MRPKDESPARRDPANVAGVRGGRLFGRVTSKTGPGWPLAGGPGCPAAFGRPYNYQFDFRTETALVCSQLVHKAYETINGIRCEPKMSGGRLLLSPNEIAIKYDQEMGRDDAEMDFVLFLDGTGIGRVVKRGVDEFRESWSRPKWHIVFQDDKE